MILQISIIVILLLNIVTNILVLKRMNKKITADNTKD
jgi:hypothetical protein